MYFVMNAGCPGTQKGDGVRLAQSQPRGLGKTIDSNTAVLRATTLCEQDAYI